MTDAISLEELALELSKAIALRDDVTKHDASDPMDMTILETLHKIGHLAEGVPGVRPRILKMVLDGEIAVHSPRGKQSPVNLSDVSETNFDKWCMYSEDANKVRSKLLTAPQVAPVETVEQRRARYLAWHTEEQRTNKHGALQRVFEREAKQNPKADRSNIGKDITKARGTAITQKQSGAMFGQLVKVVDGKRQN